MKTLIILSTALFLTLSVKAQNEDLKYASFNILTNGIIGGIGSAIHHKNNESLIEAFGQGFWKGSLSGSLNYAGMKLVQYSASKNTYSYVWPGRIINSLGSSILYNAIANDKILASVNMNLYFVNVHYSKSKFQARIDPFTLGTAIYFAFDKNQEFSFKNSLQTGSISFYENESTLTTNIYQLGIAIGNTISVKKENRYIRDNSGLYVLIDKNRLIRHEIIHTFQYEQFQGLNLLSTDKICKKINTKLNQYLILNPNFITLYLISNISGYSNNIFENQAYYYSK